ncbi:alpha/beta fold hydrolase [Actinomycetospora sp. NBRC 106378]|uniref:alpha/beta fold hydrolase n=1 Tax=Actinomycetospora sp. NBRC 106378 TaxID=3032208 RepID=UPI0024A29690|nr:alpha/beta fold hydrolase [Actinomycetospora sp. NBRC 106378]GLZ53798.1 hypothetical protein Acsp07_34150 [Actinomycetospora sp. NBRC 106378]
MTTEDIERGSRAVCYRRYGGPEMLELVQREDPRPGPGQVRLVVRAAAVNPFDQLLRDGLLATSNDPDAPVIPGTDVAGVIEALGEGVADLVVGDEVLGRATGGSHAEKALASVKEIVAKPPTMSWQVAGALEVAVHTARSALDELSLEPGAVLLVHGASGGVGTMAVQAAVADGLHVIGSAGPARQEQVTTLGATPVVYGDGLVSRVRAALGRPESTGPVVDAVLDVAGRGELDDLLALAGGPEQVVTIARPDAGVHGVRFVGRRWVPGALADATAQIAAGRLRPPTTVAYPLEQAVQANRDDRDGTAGGRPVLLPGPGSFAAPTVETITRSDVVSRDGTRIGFLRQGNGPGVVLVQGAMATAEQYDELARELARDFTVVRPDRRGRGMSPRPYDVDHDIARDVEDLDAVLAATGADRLFGLSSGAVITLEAARTLPRVARAAVYEPPFYAAGRSDNGERRLGEEIERGDLAAALVTALLTAGTAPAPFRVLPRGLARWIAALALRVHDLVAVPPQRFRDLLPGIRYDFAVVGAMNGKIDTFAGMTTPVLLLSGTKSPAFLRDRSRELARPLPHAEHVELDGLGHSGPWNTGRGGRPALVAAALQRFLT